MSGTKSIICNVHENARMYRSWYHFYDNGLIFQFATEGLAVVLFMKITGMASLDDIPEGLPKSKSSRSTWLHHHCRLVVDHVNSATNPDDTQLVEEAMRQPTPGADDTSLFPFCFCREG